jgi:hypothetical protein
MLVPANVVAVAIGLDATVILRRAIRLRDAEPAGAERAYPSRRSMMVALAMPPPSHIVCRP